jgi:hypothetical protein
MKRYRIGTTTLLGSLTALIVCVSGAGAVSDVIAPRLPADADEAQQMIAEGTLDYQLWKKIEPYYAAPLCVPQGDLAVLEALFPDLPSTLPVRESDLSRYRPWDRKAIADFFEDYPELVPFKPLLSFEDRPGRRFPARVGFYFSRWGADDTARQYALLSTGDSSRRFEASGRAVFTNSYSRWDRRSICVEPVKQLSVALGNFNPGFNDRLLYGYFPPVRKKDSTVSGNWLYGSERTWNGMLLQIGSRAGTGDSGNAGATAFLHDLPTERITGIEGTARLANAIACFGGISGVAAADSSGATERDLYTHAGVTVAAGRSWKAAAELAVNPNHWQSVPWSLTIAHRNERSGFDAALTGIPRGFDAPRSRIAYLLRKRFSPADTVQETFLDAEISFFHRMSAAFKVQPAIECVFAGDKNGYLAASMGISGKGRLAYDFAYVWSPVNGNDGGSRAVHQARVSLSCDVTERIAVESDLNLTETSSGSRSSRFSVLSTCKIGDALELSPLLVYTSQGSVPPKTKVGVRQTLFLFEKTFSELTIEQEIPFSSWETLCAKGRMQFFF